ncbi:MAG: hypothetical protein EON98_02885, partial [Chitinophagaceae bacterium]
MIQPLEYQRFQLTDVSGFKEKMLNWLKQFGIFCLLDNHHYGIQPHRTEWLVAVDVNEFVSGDEIGAADQFIKESDWAFGHLSYELLHSSFKLSKTKKDSVDFPPFYFFRPRIVLEYNEELKIYAENPVQVFQSIMETDALVDDLSPVSCHLTPVLSKEEYINKIKLLQEHIHRGDCYEVNFCQEFFSRNCTIDPFSCFQKLMNLSPNPFSA